MTLLWLDLETTGLNPTDDHILEVAWQATFNDLITLSQPQTRVLETTPEAWEILKHSIFIHEMHSATRLLDDLVSNDIISLSKAEAEIIETVEKILVVNDEPVYLAGASVHFDLAFIGHWMPRLRKLLSHRVYDTSTLKAFFGPLDVQHDVVNINQHRALDDVQETLAVARQYRAIVAELLGK